MSVPSTFEVDSGGAQILVVVIAVDDEEDVVDVCFSAVEAPLLMNEEVDFVFVVLVVVEDDEENGVYEVRVKSTSTVLLQVCVGSSQPKLSVN